MKKSSFVQGAFILGMAALISKVLGGIYRIPYQNIVGNEGLALYNLVYPMYTTLLTLCTFGFPIAVSKFVSENIAQGDIYGAERVYKLAFRAMILAGAGSFLFLFFGAPILASLTGDSGATIVIKSMSFALLLVPLNAVTRGYFQGWQMMMPTAVSQVYEQMVRVAVSLTLAWFLMKQSVELAAAGAVFGAFAGSIVGSLVLIKYYKRHLRGLIIERRRQTLIFLPEATGKLFRRMAIFALPICFGTLVLPLFNLADSYTVINMLQYTGLQTLDARYMFGVYSKALPIVQITSLVSIALSLALIPSISEAKSLQQFDQIRRRTPFALRLTLIISMPAAFGIAVLAEPINIALFNETIGSDIIKVLSFSAIFSTLMTTSSGVLQGVGESNRPAINLFIGLCIKIVLNVFLIISIGIMGAAIATITAYMVALGFNLRDLHKHTGIKWSIGDLVIRPLVSSLIMSVAVILTAKGSSWLFQLVISAERLVNALVVFVAIVVGVIVYALAVLYTRCLRRDELESVPKIGPLIKRLSERVGI